MPPFDSIANTTALSGSTFDFQAVVRSAELMTQLTNQVAQLDSVSSRASRSTGSQDAVQNQLYEARLHEARLDIIEGISSTAQEMLANAYNIEHEETLQYLAALGEAMPQMTNASQEAFCRAFADSLVVDGQMSAGEAFMLNAKQFFEHYQVELQEQNDLLYGKGHKIEIAALIAEQTALAEAAERAAEAAIHREARINEYLADERFDFLNETEKAQLAERTDTVLDNSEIAVRESELAAQLEETTRKAADDATEHYRKGVRDTIMPALREEGLAGRVRETHERFGGREYVMQSPQMQQIITYYREHGELPPNCVGLLDDMEAYLQENTRPIIEDLLVATERTYGPEVSNELRVKVMRDGMVDLSELARLEDPRTQEALRAILEAEANGTEADLDSEILRIAQEAEFRIQYEIVAEQYSENASALVVELSEAMERGDFMTRWDNAVGVEARMDILRSDERFSEFVRDRNRDNGSLALALNMTSDDIIAYAGAGELERRAQLVTHASEKGAQLAYNKTILDNERQTDRFVRRAESTYPDGSGVREVLDQLIAQRSSLPNDQYQQLMQRFAEGEFQGGNAELQARYARIEVMHEWDSTVTAIRIDASRDLATFYPGDPTNPDSLNGHEEYYAAYQQAILDVGLKRAEYTPPNENLTIAENDARIERNFTVAADLVRNTADLTTLFVPKEMRDLLVERNVITQSQANIISANGKVVYEYLLDTYVRGENGQGSPILASALEQVNREVPLHLMTTEERTALILREMESEAEPQIAVMRLARIIDDSNLTTAQLQQVLENATRPGLSAQQAVGILATQMGLGELDPNMAAILASGLTSIQSRGDQMARSLIEAARIVADPETSPEDRFRVFQELSASMIPEGVNVEVVRDSFHARNELNALFTHVFENGLPLPTEEEIRVAIERGLEMDRAIAASEAALGDDVEERSRVLNEAETAMADALMNAGIANRELAEETAVNHFEKASHGMQAANRFGGLVNVTVEGADGTLYRGFRNADGDFNLFKTGDVAATATEHEPTAQLTNLQTQSVGVGPLGQG